MSTEQPQQASPAEIPAYAPPSVDGGLSPQQLRERQAAQKLDESSLKNIIQGIIDSLPLSQDDPDLNRIRSVVSSQVWRAARAGQTTEEGIKAQAIRDMFTYNSSTFNGVNVDALKPPNIKEVSKSQLEFNIKLEEAAIDIKKLDVSKRKELSNAFKDRNIQKAIGKINEGEINLAAEIDLKQQDFDKAKRHFLGTITQEELDGYIIQKHEKENRERLALIEKKKKEFEDQKEIQLKNIKAELAQIGINNSEARELQAKYASTVKDRKAEIESKMSGWIEEQELADLQTELDLIKQGKWIPSEFEQLAKLVQLNQLQRLILTDQYNPDDDSDLPQQRNYDDDVVKQEVLAELRQQYANLTKEDLVRMDNELRGLENLQVVINYGNRGWFQDSRFVNMVKTQLNGILFPKYGKWVSKGFSSGANALQIVVSSLASSAALGLPLPVVPVARSIATANIGSGFRNEQKKHEMELDRRYAQAAYLHRVGTRLAQEKRKSDLQILVELPEKIQRAKSIVVEPRNIPSLSAPGGQPIVTIEGKNPYSYKLLGRELEDLAFQLDVIGIEDPFDHQYDGVKVVEEYRNLRFAYHKRAFDLLEGEQKAAASPYFGNDPSIMHKIRGETFLMLDKNDYVYKHVERQLDQMAEELKKVGIKVDGDHNVQGDFEQMSQAQNDLADRYRWAKGRFATMRMIAEKNSANKLFSGITEEIVEGMLAHWIINFIKANNPLDKTYSNAEDQSLKKRGFGSTKALLNEDKQKADEVINSYIERLNEIFKDGVSEEELEVFKEFNIFYLDEHGEKQYPKDIAEARAKILGPWLNGVNQDRLQEAFRKMDEEGLDAVANDHENNYGFVGDQELIDAQELEIVVEIRDKIVPDARKVISEVQEILIGGGTPIASNEFEAKDQLIQDKIMELRKYESFCRNAGYDENHILQPDPIAELIKQLEEQHNKFVDRYRLEKILEPEMDTLEAKSDYLVIDESNINQLLQQTEELERQSKLVEEIRGRSADVYMAIYADDMLLYVESVRDKIKSKINVYEADEIMKEVKFKDDDIELKVPLWEGTIDDARNDLELLNKAINKIVRANNLYPGYKADNAYKLKLLREKRLNLEQKIKDYDDLQAAA